jgi:hypothetical protein
MGERNRKHPGTAAVVDTRSVNDEQHGKNKREIQAYFAKWWRGTDRCPNERPLSLMPTMSPHGNRFTANSRRLSTGNSNRVTARQRQGTKEISVQLLWARLCAFSESTRLAVVRLLLTRSV